MANLSSYNFSQLTDLIERSFTYNRESLPQKMRQSAIVIEDPLEQNTGDTKRFAERIDRNQYASKRPEGDTSKQALTQYGYEKDMQVTYRSLEISITKLMRTAGKDKEMQDRITDLVQVCPNAIDLDLAHRLTFAFTTSYTDRDGFTVDTTVGDGKALIDPAHTLTGSGTTYSNQIAGNPQFSKGALENAEQLFVEETFNNLGEKIYCNPDTIITTDDPTTVNQVKELLRATADVATSNEGTFNVYQEKYNHLMSERIATDANGGVDTNKKKYWGLADSAKSDFYYCELEAPYLKTPTDGNNGEEFSSENWNYLAATSYGMAIVSGRWIKMSKGDGS